MNGSGWNELYGKEKPKVEALVSLTVEKNYFFVIIHMPRCYISLGVIRCLSTLACGVECIVHTSIIFSNSLPWCGGSFAKSNEFKSLTVANYLQQIIVDIGNNLYHSIFYGSIKKTQLHYCFYNKNILKRIVTICWETDFSRLRY